MSEGAGTLEILIRFVAEAISPLANRLRAGEAAQLIEEVGLRLPDAIVGDTGAVAALSAGAGEAQELVNRLPALVAAISNADPDDLGSIVTLATETARVVEKIVSTTQSLVHAKTALDAAAAALTPAQRASITAILPELPRRLLDYTLLAHIDEKMPAAVPLLSLTGVVDDFADSGDPEDPLKPPYRRRRLDLGALAKLVSDPAGHLRGFYRWGDADFDGMELFQRLYQMIDEADFPVVILQPPGQPPVFEAYLARLQADTAVNPPGMKFRLRRAAAVDFERTTPVGGPWSFLAQTHSRFEGGTEGAFSPAGQMRFVPPTGTATLDVRGGLRAKRADGSAMLLLGQAGGTRIEFDSMEALAGLTASWNPSAGNAEGDPVVTIGFEKLSAVLDMGGGDGFVNTLAGGGRGEIDITVGATWSPTDGLQFTGSSTIEIAIPAHRAIGPATIETVYLIGGFEDSSFPLEVSAALRGQLGPLQATVDRIGIKFLASFPAAGGNIGPMQLDVGFKPPNGIGLSLEGGGFRGGGYLLLDPDRGEYAGALELEFQGIIHLKAVGILTTRAPDGSDMVSLLIIITAEFPPIQLGYGFTLLGVGGLLGLNRTVMFEVLRAGTRDGSLNSVLFPVDVVANAPRIISDLKRIFPPLDGRFLIGPMGKLGWGTPTLVSLELGLILEIPRPAFAIVGVLRITLPAEELAIVKLQVNFVGVIDFEQKQISFDASLYDSYALIFPLTGDMAVRIYWGENANFLLTVGGFHPSYTPPPLGLGPLRRLSIILFAGNPRLFAEAYFAVTSNTVQFGAKIELYAGADVFNVYGFLSFDALIHFDPFRFIVQIGAMLAVRSGTSTLFGIRLDLVLEGPTPYHARGRGSFEISFIFTVTIEVGFDVTVGEERTTTLPPVRVLPLLHDAVNDNANWRALNPSSVNSQVALRELGPEAGLVVHPFGILAVSQKVVPLNLAIQHLGSRKIDGGNTFRIDSIRVGSETAPLTAVEEQFAAAQYLEMSDAEKISRRSFELLSGGAQVSGGDRPRSTFVRRVDVVYEVIYLRRPRLRLFHALAKGLFDRLLFTSAAAKSSLGRHRKQPTGLGTPAVTLGAGHFAIVSTKDLSLHGTEMTFASQAAAAVALNEFMAKDRGLTGKIQIVPTYEMAA
jgi:hypothetical protein